MDFLLGIDRDSFNAFVIAWGALGIISALSLYFSRQLPISSRRESHQLAFLGLIDKKLGWIVMETPILIAVLYFYLAGSQPLNVSVVMVGAFVLHYINRALIYPRRIKVQGKLMPVSIVLTTMVFYVINGYLVGQYFGSLRTYTTAWLWDPRFVIGSTLFITGFAINLWADTVLINLRKPGERGYRIPRGGLFRLVSCPNYFGEIVEWIGFAVMSWSLPGTMYALWVSLALLATGLGTHRWYHEHFGARYPQQRRAVIPHLL